MTDWHEDMLQHGVDYVLHVLNCPTFDLAVLHCPTFSSFFPKSPTNVLLFHNNLPIIFFFKQLFIYTCHTISKIFACGALKLIESNYFRSRCTQVRTHNRPVNVLHWSLILTENLWKSYNCPTIQGKNVLQKGKKCP